jgi:hypothetical protein
VLVQGCYIYDNGNVGSIYEHNNYTESQGIVFQYNHFGPLCSGCSGNNLKDRSAGTVIRYNWIESGNRQLDLVESDYTEITGLASYRSTYVYGNILIEPDGAGNSQICHYGGDNGDATLYRKGNLYFYNNTVVSTRAGNTTLFRLSTNSETANCFNNIIYVSATGDKLAMLDADGALNLQNNWMKTSWANSHSGLTGSINNQGGIVLGTSPGFTNEATKDYHLIASSDCINKGKATPANYPVEFEYKTHQDKITRTISGTIDLGAYEYGNTTGINAASAQNVLIFPNPTKDKLFIECSSSIKKIELKSILGSNLIQQNPLSTNAQLDCSHLAKGIYIIKIETNKGVISKIIEIE